MNSYGMLVSFLGGVYLIFLTIVVEAQDQLGLFVFKVLPLGLGLGLLSAVILELIHAS